MKKFDTIRVLGTICLFYWLLDFINIVFIIRIPAYLLWFSTTGLLLTSIALIKKSPAWISSMFCALFAMEMVWVLDFLFHIFFNVNFLGLTNYLFARTFSKKDFIMSMYHLLIPTSLLYAQIKIKAVYRYAWIGSFIYASILAIMTFFLVDSSQDVNCVHNLSRCEGLILFIFKATPYPWRILTTILLVTIIIFIPTNYILLRIAKKSKWGIYPVKN